MQTYSNPARETDPHALPDVELWEEEIAECANCGERLPVGHIPSDGDLPCESCGQSMWKQVHETGWWYWYRFPGCVPDSGVFGPFESEESAREDFEDNEIDIA